MRGETAMMRATSWGRKANVVELVKAGANPDLQDKNGDTVVIIATRKCIPGILQELVRAGANLNIQNKEGLTALIISVREQSSELTEILLTGVDIDTDLKENNTHWTALFFAAKRGDVTITQLLLRAGANAFIKDKNGCTALDVAAREEEGTDHDLVCELLSQHVQDRQHTGDEDASKNTVTSGRRSFEVLRNLVNRSRQRIAAVYSGVERILKATEKKKSQQPAAAASEQEQRAQAIMQKRSVHPATGDETVAEQTATE